LSKTAIRPVNRHLPHARLYLDDLYEIEAILSAACAKLKDPPTIAFEYEVDQGFKLTTHQDLKDHEGFSSYFDLNIISNSRFAMNERVLQFYSSLSPGFSIPYWLQNEQWAVFGEIESVFKSREDKLKSVCDAMPFLPFLVAVILLGILSSVAGRRGYVSVSTASDAVGWIIAASIVVIGMGRWKKNGIYFRDERQDQRRGRKIVTKESKS
jgi:hypothetical protein